MNLFRQSKRVQKMASILDIPQEIVLDLPKITLIGNLQMYLENHRGIIEYTSSRVRLATTLGELEVLGESLTLRSISQEDIHLDGLIKGVQFNR